MPEFVEVDSFQRRIEGGAGGADEFLALVRERSVAEAFQVPLQLKKHRKGRVVLLAKNIRFGGVMRKTRPMQLEVFADPSGRHLSVGYQLTKVVQTGILMESGMNPRFEAGRDRKDRSPANQREIGAMMADFHHGVFLPALERHLDRSRESPA